MPVGSFSSARHAINVLARVRALWRLKVLITLIVWFTFCVPYFLIGNYAFMPVRVLRLTWLDRAFGFHLGAWVWIYQSEYLLVNFIPWLSTSRNELRRYIRGFALLSLISFAVFLVFPILGPKPPVTDARGMYWLLQQYDVPFNSLPSLHAGMVVFTLGFGNRILRGHLSRAASLLFASWGALILIATVVTKEHYVIDTVAGGLLGFAIHRWTWNRTCGFEKDSSQDRADVPGGIEVMVGAADGVNLPRQIEQVAEQNSSTVVRAQDS